MWRVLCRSLWWPSLVRRTRHDWTGEWERERNENCEKKINHEIDRTWHTVVKQTANHRQMNERITARTLVYVRADSINTDMLSFYEKRCIRMTLNTHKRRSRRYSDVRKQWKWMNVVFLQIQKSRTSTTKLVCSDNLYEKPQIWCSFLSNFEARQLFYKL